MHIYAHTHIAINLRDTRPHLKLHVTSVCLRGIVLIARFPEIHDAYFTPEVRPLQLRARKHQRKKNDRCTLESDPKLLLLLLLLLRAHTHTHTT